jgi:ribosomal protein S27E
VISDEPPRVSFLAPLTASVMAPVTESIAASARSATRLPGAEIIEVTCPRCGDVIAVWARLTRCLYKPRRGGLGAPLSTDRRENVAVTCGRCGKTWHTSGRAVGRHLHNGRPPLA